MRNSDNDNNSNNKEQQCLEQLNDLKKKYLRKLYKYHGAIYWILDIEPCLGADFSLEQHRNSNHEALESLVYKVTEMLIREGDDSGVFPQNEDFGKPKVYFWRVRFMHEVFKHLLD